MANAVLPEAEQTSANTQQPRNWLRWALVLGIGGVVAGYYAFGLDRYLSWQFVRANIDRLTDWVRDNYLFAALIYFAAYAAVTALSLPAAAILSLAAGALFGRWWGTLIVLWAATLGATLAMLTSRYLFREWVRRRLGPRLAKLEEGVAKDGAYYLFTLRLIAAVPFFLINLGMGLTPMRVRTYAVVSFFGMLPGTFMFVNAGTELSRIESPRDVLSPSVLISMALLGLLPLVLRWIVPRRQG